jgi:GNAT superfamily N-acetyltransferase
MRAVPASALDGGQLAAVQVIYAESFPPELRVPFAELDDSAAGGAGGGLVAALDGDVPAGFAALRRLDAAIFVRYFAVAAARRRQGTGRQLWQLLPAAVPGWPDRVVLEVEDPADSSDPAEQQVRRGRIAFWRSCGLGLLPVPGYVMPDLTGAGPEPMLLMADPPCAGEELRGLVRAIYDGRYGRPASDPLVRRALASVPG